MNRDRDEGGFEETLELLRETHREAIPEAHFAAVRARVLSQLAAERRPWWRGIWACGFAAAVAAAMLLAAFVGRKHAMVGQALPPANRSIDQARHPSPTLALRSVSTRRMIGRRKRLPHDAEPAPYRVVGPPAPQHLVVKLVTNDPNVVIYWVTGE
jgi:hypothetical protein